MHFIWCHTNLNLAQRAHQNRGLRCRQWRPYAVIYATRLQSSYLFAVLRLRSYLNIMYSSASSPLSLLYIALWQCRWREKKTPERVVRFVASHWGSGYSLNTATRSQSWRHRSCLFFVFGERFVSMDPFAGKQPMNRSPARRSLLGIEQIFSVRDSGQFVLSKDSNKSFANRTFHLNKFFNLEVGQWWGGTYFSYIT